jgi:hypothetical protein
VRILQKIRTQNPNNRVHILFWNQALRKERRVHVFVW